MRQHVAVKLTRCTLLHCRHEQRRVALPELREIGRAGNGRYLPQFAISCLVVRQDAELVVGVEINQFGRRQFGLTQLGMPVSSSPTPALTTSLSKAMPLRRAS